MKAEKIIVRMISGTLLEVVGDDEFKFGDVVLFNFLGEGIKLFVLGSPVPGNNWHNKLVFTSDKPPTRARWCSKNNVKKISSEEWAEKMKKEAIEHCLIK